MRGKVITLPHLNWGDIHERASAMVGKNIHYHLQYPNGGTDPEASEPCDRQTRGCDCIGFAAWAAGFDRYQPGGKGIGKLSAFPYYDAYINTDSMVLEATERGKWFSVLKEPESGCFIVAKSYWRKLPYPKRVIGHIGVVVDCSEWATKGLKGIGVVHCSPSNVKRPGNKNGSAVWKTDGTVWAGYPKVYFIRFNREYAMGLKGKQ